jgi:putative exosortase-associated protein (TIGR04073 family)
MRNKAFHFLSIIAVLSLIAGCAGPEQKFSRGLNNTVEFARMGELRRSMEQSAIFDAPGGITMGFFRGVDRSFARTGAGLYEVVTFPIPNGRYGDYGPVYHPAYAHGVINTANPVYPDSYQPDWIADTMLQPDTSLGFAGGDIAPYLPGSRFRVFDN